MLEDCGRSKGFFQEYYKNSAKHTGHLFALLLGNVTDALYVLDKKTLSGLAF